MIRSTRLLTVCALLASAGSARAYTHETTTRGHPETGQWLWWNTRQVMFRVNATSATTTPCQSAAGAQDATAALAADAAAAAGFATWPAATRAGESAPCTDFSFTHGAPTTVTAVGRDGINVVVFRSGRCIDVWPANQGACSLNIPGDCPAKLNCWDSSAYGDMTLGLTTVSFDSTTGEIFEADMELNGWNGATPAMGGYFTCESATVNTCANPPYGKPGCSAVDVQAVVTHEAGHVLGLDHVCDTSSSDALYKACPSGPTPIMAPTVGDFSMRTLAPDDVEGVCRIYPKGGATLKGSATGGASSGSSGSGGGGGCSTGGTGGIAALLAAAVAGWRARRSRHGSAGSMTP